MDAEQTGESNGAIEHRDVPQAHQGLHGFLYSSEDEHSATEVAVPEGIVISTTDIVPLEAWCEAASNAKVAGVYAVLDRDRVPQYIGYSRNVALSLRGHLTQLGAATCAFMRVQPFKFPRREDMEALRDAWIAELDSVPSGNAADSGLWAGTVAEAAIAAMSAAERQAYEEKKLKLRKAMADAELSRAQPSTETEHDRRQNLEAAVAQDDWSAVIQDQTEQTLPGH